MIKINLLPWREQVRQAKKINFIITIIVAMIIAAIFVGLMHLVFRSNLQEQQARNTYLQSQIDLQSATIMALSKKNKLQTTVVGELQFLFNLRQKSYQAVELLDELARIIPEAISLTRIIRNGKTITLMGMAKSNLEITLLMEKLTHSNLFEQPELTEITAKENVAGEERLFQIQVVMRG